MKTPLLEVENLSKTFRSDWTLSPIKAVEDFSLSINEHEIFGFLGHNGAGKTTFIKCVMGIIRPTRGNISYCGVPLNSYKQRSSIGFLPEQPYFYEHLSVLELLNFFYELYDLDNQIKEETVGRVLDRLRLEPKKHSKLQSLSKGWQQRVGFAQAIMSSPKLLLLDEPFSGLDPAGRKEFRELIFELRESGTTIVLSTHILSDIEELCDRVSIMKAGKLWKVIDLAQQDALSDMSYNMRVPNERLTSEVKRTVSSLGSIVGQAKSSRGTSALINCADYARAQELLKVFVNENIPVEELEQKRTTLEDEFMKSIAE